jgi:hypothetical protein
MARRKEITAEAVVALGAEALAEALVAHAAVDPVLRKKLGMMLAAARGAGSLGDEIEKRLKTIARSRAYVERDKRKALAQELDHLRATLATRLAESDRARAVELLWDFIAMADAVLQRIGEHGEMEEIFDAAMADLGRLSIPSTDGRALARRVLAYCDRDHFGASDTLISHMSEALGAEGRAEIRSATEAAIRTAPPATEARDWRAEARRRHHAFRLALLADLERDPDAYVAALRAGGMEATHALDAAERLLTAGRPAEALEWLDRPQRRLDGEGLADVDLRIAALEALGRRPEAQAARWRRFEDVLSAAHLRAYLKNLPDFEDFDAEQKALDLAEKHAQAARALVFFIEWRALDRADRLTRERATALDGRLYEALRPAAEALEAKFPEAASLLYRRMIESVLERGSSKQYVYAARDLKSCAEIAPRLPSPGSIESHERFLAGLRASHGRKYGFWGLMEPGGVRAQTRK